MKRICFLSPDEVHAHAAIQALREQGVPDRHLYVVAGEGVQTEGLPDAGPEDDDFIPAKAHKALTKGVEDYFRGKQEMALADFREIVNTTRKWMIPLLEYLDRTQVTMRKGDVRIKRKSVKGNG